MKFRSHPLIISVKGLKDILHEMRLFKVENQEGFSSLFSSDIHQTRQVDQKTNVCIYYF
jgi:hypothetical protein